MMNFFNSEILSFRNVLRAIMLFAATLFAIPVILRICLLDELPKLSGIVGLRGHKLWVMECWQSI